MKYTSPLHLLPERNITALSPTELKRWKQELLLQFDLYESTTINVKDKEYDKNSILAGFDLLRDSPAYHLRLYKDKILLNFIEHGELDVFDRPKDWLSWIDEAYLAWLRPLFISQFSHLIYQCTITQNKTSIRALEEIYYSGFTPPEVWQDECYQKTYTFLNNCIKSVKKIIHGKSFATGEKPSSLKLELGEYLSEHYVDVLEILPGEFRALRENYGDIAHNVLYYAIIEERRYFNFDRKSRLILAKAAKIDARIHNDEYAKNLLKFIGKREGIQGLVMDLYWEICELGLTMKQ